MKTRICLNFFNQDNETLVTGTGNNKKQKRMALGFGKKIDCEMGFIPITPSSEPSIFSFRSELYPTIDATSAIDATSISTIDATSKTLKERNMTKNVVT